MNNTKSLKEQVLDCEKAGDELNKYITEVLKVAEPEKPPSIPAFPADVTSITSEDTGRLLAAYDSEIAYIRFLLARVEVKLLQARAVIKTYKDCVFLGHRSSLSYNDATAWTAADKDIVEADTEARSIESQQILLQSRLDIFSKYSASISREISRRKQDSFQSSESGGGEKAGDRGTYEDKQSARIKKIGGRELNPLKNSKK